MSEMLRGYARRIAASRPPPGTVGIFWLGQAGFALRSADTTLVVDAFLSPRPDRLADAPVTPDELDFADGFLATHEHRDHLDLPSWPLFAAAAPAAHFVVPAPLVARAAEAVHRGRVIGALPDSEITIGGARVLPVPARHGVHVADAYSFGLVPGEYRFLGYVIELGGVRVYHAGDTIRYDGMAERLRAHSVDVALLPINGRTPEREAQDIAGNLDPAEAVALARRLGAQAVVPLHWDMFAANTGDLTALAGALRDPLTDPVVTIPVHGRELAFGRA
jgi:L-ascorbate metabolism protein UlaG (beta-lactamase superfamily)